MRSNEKRGEKFSEFCFPLLEDLTEDPVLMEKDCTLVNLSTKQRKNEKEDEKE